VPEGGSLVIGAEQEPDCFDWMGSCGGSSWGYWMGGVTTMPRSYDVVVDNGKYSYKPNILLTGEAQLETTPVQKVTYNINPQAVWSDGEPITSTDFKYTWDQVANGDAIYDRSGYQDIESVDDSDPATAVVTFKQGKTYADWKGTLFGGQFGIYPSHILQGKDRNAEVKSGYTWSGGPWIATWEQGSQITLKPNPKWYGDKPKLDEVIFKVQADTSSEFQAFKAGETKVIYPQPQLDAVDQIQAGLSDVNQEISAETVNAEALWFNNSAAPFDNMAVRQAVGYSVDRDAIVEALFGKLGVHTALQYFNNGPVIDHFSDTEAFSQYKPDMNKVNSLLQGAGYTKGSDGKWSKGGQPLSFTIKSTQGNKRRELTEQILQQQLSKAGMTLNIENVKSGDLFGDILPKGDFQLTLYAGVLTSLAPVTYNQMYSGNIPTEASGFSGNNWTRTNIPELDPLSLAVDENLDDSAREDANKQADKIEAENAVTLPLDPLPNILLWSKSVVGPIQDNAVFGPFWNLEQWGTS
jgi:peptide/nickel transport system substrate-binding protein